MWMMPLHLHVNQKSDYDDDEVVKIIAKLERKQSNAQQNMEQTQNPTMGATINNNDNNNNRITTLEWTAAYATGGFNAF